MFGAVLLVALPVVIVTGFLSYAAYEPRFPGNAFPADPLLRFPHFSWPASPSWLYRLNQGLHVGLGLALVPVVLAKLWSVVPKLFTWPPARSLAQVLERLTIALLVGGILFELVTGVLNIQYDYVFGFDFYTGHYYGAWVFLSAFLAHVVLKLPVMLRSLRQRSLREELRTPTYDPQPPEPDPDGLVAARAGRADDEPPRRARPGGRGGPDRHRGHRRGDARRQPAPHRAAVAAGPVLRRRPHRLPGQPDRRRRRRSRPSCTGDGLAAAAPRADPGQPVPRRAAGDGAAHRRAADRLRRGMVDGADLDRRAAARPRRPGRASDPDSAVVSSLERNGAFARAVLGRQHLTHPDALLALQVNGVDLSLDHGFPARVIAPSLPGVHNTKWVRSIEVRA